MARLLGRTLRGRAQSIGALGLGGLVALALLVPPSMAGCGGRAGGTAVRDNGTVAGEARWGTVDMLTGGDRPPALVLGRDGDPRAAVAVAVAVDDGGSAAAVALSAVAEARLRPLGFDDLSIEADGLGYRVGATVDGPEEAERLSSALRDALLGPLSGSAGSDLSDAVARRLAALNLRRIEAPALLPIVDCTGELAARGVDDSPDSGAAATAPLDAIEAWRKASHVAARIAFGVVAPRATATTIAEALRGKRAWPSASTSPSRTSRAPASDAAGVYVQPARTAQVPRLKLAITLADPPRALAGLERALAADGTLAAQLAAMDPPWRVTDSSLSVYSRRACAAVTLDIDRAPPGTWIEWSAARASAIVAEAVTRQVRSATVTDPWFAARRALDPRKGALLAAWWALASDHASAGEKSGRDTDDAARSAMAIALALPGSSSLSDGTRAFEAAASSRLAVALRLARTEIQAPAIDRKVAVEQGQGELWLLAASPCATAGERDEDPGETALAVVSAMALRDRLQGVNADGVAVEPWITPDGIGLAAHAARAPGEDPAELGARVGRALGRTLSTPTIDGDALASGRATLLARFANEPAAEGRAFAAAANALSPSHAAYLAPFGSWESLARASAERSVLRLRALRAGPVRLAVLANTDARQADEAVAAFAAWLPSGADRRRACPPADATPEPPRAGQLEVQLGARAAGAQALVAVPLPGADAANRAAAEWTVLAMLGTDGWLARALAAASPRVTASARIAGGERVSALLIDVRASVADLDPSVAQIRALLQRIQKGAIAPADRDRAAALHQRIEKEQAFDPRRRLVDRWRGAPPAPAPPPALDAWRAWAATALAEDRLLVVLARPSR